MIVKKIQEYKCYIVKNQFKFFISDKLDGAKSLVNRQIFYKILGHITGESQLSKNEKMMLLTFLDKQNLGFINLSLFYQFIINIDNLLLESEPES